MNFRVLVFDWDGTIVDSVPAIIQSIQAAARACGCPEPDASVVTNLIGLRIDEIWQGAVPGRSERCYASLIACYRNELARLKPEPFLGIRELLLDLRARGHKTAIASGKSRRGLNEMLATTGMQPLFDITRCAEESESKPSPQMLHEIAQALGMASKDLLMIGDSHLDAAMARNARVAFRGVAFREWTAQALQESGEADAARSVDALRQWLWQNA